MVRGAKYDWDEHNEAHVALHGITKLEVEEVLANEPPHSATHIDEVSGEERNVELGHTDAQRVLFVVWTPRRGRTRPVTAFPAKRKTRIEYWRTR